MLVNAVHTCTQLFCCHSFFNWDTVMNVAKHFFQLNRVKVVEKEKDDLEGVKNEALEFLTKENEIIMKKNLLYHKYM